MTQHTPYQELQLLDTDGHTWLSAQPPDDAPCYYTWPVRIKTHEVPHVATDALHHWNVTYHARDGVKTFHFLTTWAINSWIDLHYDTVL